MLSYKQCVLNEEMRKSRGKMNCLKVSRVWNVKHLFCKKNNFHFLLSFSETLLFLEISGQYQVKKTGLTTIATFLLLFVFSFTTVCLEHSHKKHRYIFLLGKMKVNKKCQEVLLATSDWYQQWKKSFWTCCCTTTKHCNETLCHNRSHKIT